MTNLKNLFFIGFMLLNYYQLQAQVQLDNGRNIPFHRINSHFFYENTLGDTVFEIFTDSLGEICKSYHYVKLNSQDLWVSVDIPGRVEFGCFLVNKRFPWGVNLSKRNAGRIKKGAWNVIEGTILTIEFYDKKGNLVNKIDKLKVL